MAYIERNIKASNSVAISSPFFCLSALDVFIVLRTLFILGVFGPGGRAEVEIDDTALILASAWHSGFG